VHDVSQQGLRLSTRTPLKEGETALIRFSLPGGQARTRTVSIRWVKRVRGGFEAGAEASDGGDTGGAASGASTESATETYYEAEGEFLYAEDEEEPDPLLPPLGKVAKAYEASIEEPRSVRAALPVPVTSRAASQSKERSRVVEARVIEPSADTPMLSYLALGLVAAAAAAMIVLLSSAL